MKEAFWVFGGTAVTAVLGFITWLGGKRHNENTEDSNVLASSIKSIGEAAVDVVGASTSVSELVTTMIEPLHKELTATHAEVVLLRQREQEQAKMIADLQAEMAAFERRFTAALRYIALLRQQVRNERATPHDPPHELDGFQFD